MLYIWAALRIQPCEHDFASAPLMLMNSCRRVGKQDSEVLGISGM